MLEVAARVPHRGRGDRRHASSPRSRPDAAASQVPQVLPAADVGRQLPSPATVRPRPVGLPGELSRARLPHRRGRRRRAVRRVPRTRVHGRRRRLGTGRRAHPSSRCGSSPPTSTPATTIEWPAPPRRRSRVRGRRRAGGRRLGHRTDGRPAGRRGRRRGRRRRDGARALGATRVVHMGPAVAAQSPATAERPARRRPATACTSSARAAPTPTPSTPTATPTTTPTPRARRAGSRCCRSRARSVYVVGAAQPHPGRAHPRRVGRAHPGPPAGRARRHARDRAPASATGSAATTTASCS